MRACWRVVGGRVMERRACKVDMLGGSWEVVDRMTVPLGLLVVFVVVVDDDAVVYRR